jgi:hypothetical protein
VEKNMNLNELIMKASDYTPAKKYLQDRLIPDTFINDLYANPDCTVLWGEDNIETITDGADGENGIWIKAGVEWAHGVRIPLGNEPRIVFPFYALGSAGNMSDLVGFTTRSINPELTGATRYQGRRLVADAPMVLNGHKIDPSKTIFVCEGLLDCSHLPNACSTSSYKFLPVEWKNKAILIYDNDRDDNVHVDKLGRAEAIAEGWIVVEWGSNEGHPYHEDVNAMINAKMNPQQIVDLIMSHRYKA